MTREQDNRIERIATAAGGVHVSPYSDGTAEVTIPSGASWLISPAGHLTIRPFNHSVDWNS
jgi:hypothetical protein